MNEVRHIIMLLKQPQVVTVMLALLVLMILVAVFA